MREDCDDDYDPTLTKRVKASTHKGETTVIANIDKKYYIMPRDPEQRKQFLENLQTPDGAYEAKTEGVRYSLDLGKKAAPSGKKMSYSFKLHWNGDGVIPHISITHTLPNIDINEALILNKESEIAAKNKTKLAKEADLRELIAEKTKIEDEISSKETDKLKLEHEIKEIEQQALQDGIDGLITQFDKAMKDCSVEITKERGQIVKNNTDIQELSNKIKEKQLEVTRLKKDKIHLAIVIKKQLEVAKLLRNFSELAKGNNLGIDKDNIHTDLICQCKAYIEYYDSNIQILQSECKKDLPNNPSSQPQQAEEALSLHLLPTSSSKEETDESKKEQAVMRQRDTVSAHALIQQKTPVAHNKSAVTSASDSRGFYEEDDKLDKQIEGALVGLNI